MSYLKLLNALKRRREGDDVRAILDELRELVAREPPDESTRRRLRFELERRGAVLPGIDAAWKPGVGEEYVLLAGAAGGSVGRLAVRRGGAPFGVRAGNRVGDRALQQALVAMQGLAARLATRGCGVPDASQRGHELEVSSEADEVDGSSLGLAFAAAAVSLWTNRAPSKEVAATAALDMHGNLVAVKGIESKLRALADAYPAVRRVVVAADQEPREAALEGIAIIRCASIEEALRELELSLDDVRGELLPTSEAEKQIQSLRFVQVENYSAARWREHALHARLLAAHPRIAAADAATATAFAALFHLHAGDSSQAEALAASITEKMIGELGSIECAWVYLIKASSSIDTGRCDEARALATSAVEHARTLSGRDRQDVLGRALGTLGRASMHAGHDGVAITWLREAAEHHEMHVKREAARSWITLATALRRAAQFDDALAVLDRAERALAAHLNEPETATSRLFMLYERGRVLFEVGRFDEALTCFEQVVRGQADDHDHPRVGCLRYLAAIESRNGDARAGEWLERALQVAESGSTVIARIAATTAMALLYAPDDHFRALRSRAETAWRGHVGEELTEEGVRRALRRLLY